MSAPAVAGGPVLTIRGTHYPVLLPKFRDPRLHLAAVIITLQVLGQTAFGFSLSIAQILVAIGTCAVLEIGIAFFRQTRDLVARERAPHRERSRVHPARAGDAARRLVEPSRSVDLRGDGRRLAPVEAPDPLARPPHLQPLELRARPLLPSARRDPCRATRLLVGPDVPLARVGDRTDRRRWPDHPVATPPPRSSPGASGSRLQPGSECSRQAATR